MFKFTCAALTKTGKKPVNRDNYMVGNLYVPQDHADLRNNAQGKTEQPFFVAAADGMGDEASGEKVSAIPNVVKRKLLLLLFVHCSLSLEFLSVFCLKHLKNS